MADKGGLQLLPGNHRSIDVKVPGENTSLNYGILIFILVFAVFAGLSWYERSLTATVDGLDQDLAAVEAKRSPKTEENLLTFSKQENLMATLLADHLFWSNAFNNLASHLQSQVQIKSFSAAADKNEVNFNAIAPSYSVISKQVAAFLADDAFDKVDLGEIRSLNSGRLEFSMQLRFSTAKFLKK
jgi:Tfp pilus assembly protein PilN